MKAKRLLSALILSALLPISAWADVWQDPETKVNYEYTVGGSFASVRSGGTKVPGSPEASGDIAILSTFTVDGNEYTVTNIGDRAFYGSLTSVTIPSTVTNIGEYAFNYCQNLTRVTFPSSVKSIDKYAFNSCKSLKYVHISDIGAWSSISFKGEYANPLYFAKHLYLNGVEVTSLVIPDGVTTIGDHAFENCESLVSVTIPNSVTTIGDDAFYGCSGLTSATIPNSVNTIGIRAFAGCSGLSSVSIGKSVKAIGTNAFGSCYGLTEVHISDLAAWCAITFGSGEGQYGDSEANPLTMAHHLYVNNFKIEKLTIPSSVTSIGSYAFNYCSDIDSVSIPNSVRDIGMCAFYGCTNLDNFTIPKSITRVGWGAFEKTAWYNRQPDGLLYKDNVLLPNKGDIKLIYERNGGWNDHISIKNGTRVIADYAFSGHEFLASVTIPTSVTNIGELAFSGTALTNVTIPSNVTSIGNGAFSDCYELNSITIPSSVTSISDYAFWQCFSLSSLTIPQGVTNIGEEAFFSTALTSVTIPSSVTSIGNGAFYNCNELASVISLIRKPFVIDESVFSFIDYNWYGYDHFTSATLYVPRGTKAKYEATKSWNRFQTIVEISDMPNGDVNGDQTVDVADIASVIDCMAGSEAVDKAAADVNGDGTVDVADIATIISEMAARARPQDIED